MLGDHLQVRRRSERKEAVAAGLAGFIGAILILNTTLPQVLVDIVFTPFPTERAVAMATIGSATARLADIGPLAMT